MSASPHDIFPHALNNKPGPTGGTEQTSTPMAYANFDDLDDRIGVEPVPQGVPDASDKPGRADPTADASNAPGNMSR